MPTTTVTVRSKPIAPRWNSESYIDPARKKSTRPNTVMPDLHFNEKRKFRA